MPIVIFGLNHKTAKLDLRERMAFNATQVAESLQDLICQPAVNEAVLLSTCNRMEIYADMDNQSVLPAWLSRQHMIDVQTLEAHSYYYQDVQAVKHMMRVACGLDSMVLGEPQILGQMKRAYQVSCELGAIQHALHGLFQAVFATSKQVRTETGIGSNPITLAYAMTQLAHRIYSDLSRCQVLFIGAGETIELAATHLQSQGVKSMAFASRTLTRAQSVADQFDQAKTRVMHVGDIPAVLSEFDIVITATSSQLPILSRQLVESAVRSRKHKPMLMIDLAVPRDIEASVGSLEDVYLYNMDQLQMVIAQNMHTRRQSAQRAEEIIDLKAQHFIQQRQLHRSGDLIHTYRTSMQDRKDALLQLAMKRLERGDDARDVLTQFATQLSNSMMHKPTMQLRLAAQQGTMSAKQLLQAMIDQVDQDESYVTTGMDQES